MLVKILKIETFILTYIYVWVFTYMHDNLNLFWKEFDKVINFPVYASNLSLNLSAHLFTCSIRRILLSNI